MQTLNAIGAATVAGTALARGDLKKVAELFLSMQHIYGIEDPDEVKQNNTWANEHLFESLRCEVHARLQQLLGIDDRDFEGQFYKKEFPKTGDVIVQDVRAKLAKVQEVKAAQKKLEAIMRLDPELSEAVLHEVDTENGRVFSDGDQNRLNPEAPEERWWSPWDGDFLRVSKDKFEDWHRDEMASFEELLGRAEQGLPPMIDDGQIFVDLARLTGRIIPETPAPLKAALEAMKATGKLEPKMPWDEKEKSEWEAREKCEEPTKEIDPKTARLLKQLKEQGGGLTNQP